MKKLILLFFMLLFIISGCNESPRSDINDKTTPVYQGMIISKDNNIRSLSLNHIDQNNPFNNDSNIEDIISKNTEIHDSELLDYYANLNEDLYLIVKIKNPDEFEILSFTLNGEKYQSYQFQEGSDSENLILKVNTGAKAGIIDYTIDKIKYVDGSNIKDVLIEGNQTIKVGLKFESDPITEVTGLNINATSISFIAHISDANSVIQNYDILKSVLFDGVSIIRDQNLNLGENSIEFKNIKSDTIYQFAVVCSYDNLDGTGRNLKILYKEVLFTPKMISIENLTANQDSVGFNIKSNYIDEVGEIKAIDLYSGDNLVESLTDLNIRKFEGLLSNTEYTLKISYTYDLNDGEGEQTKIYEEVITTDAKNPPYAKIIERIPHENSIELEIRLSSTDMLDTVEYTIYIYDRDILHDKKDISLNTELSSEQIKNISFDNLLSNKSYRILVICEFDLNDGKGTQSIQYDEETVTTLPQPIEITNIIVLNSEPISTGDYIHLKVDYINPSNLNIVDFYVNNIRAEITFKSDSYVTLKFIPKSSGGDYIINITSIDYSIEKQIYNLQLSTSYTKEIMILGDLNIVSINQINNNPYILKTGDYLLITLDNPTDYELTNIVINEINYSNSEFIKIDNNNYKIYIFDFHTELSIFQLTEITYIFNEMEVTKEFNISKTIYLVESEIHITTIEEFNNMTFGYAYILDNDLDFSGQSSFTPINYVTVFLGNGYKLKNITYIKDTLTSTSFAIFKNVNFIEETNVENIYISINCTENAQISTLSINCNTMKKCTASGYIEYNGNKTNSYVAGLTIGAKEVNDCINYCNINVNISCPTIQNGTINYFIGVAGIIGRGYYSEITNCLNIGNITLFCNDYSFAGGIGGDTFQAKIKSCINFGEILHNMDTITYTIIGRYCSETNNYSFINEVNFNSKSFYLESLGWSENIWNLNNININGKIYPSLN